MTEVEAPATPLRLVGRERRIGQQLMVDYTDTLGFRNPIHYGGNFASASEYGGPIASGPFALALLDDLLMEHFPSSWVRRGELSVAFTAPVRPNDVIHPEVELTALSSHDAGCELHFRVQCLNQSGGQVLAGRATVRLS